MDYRAKRTLRSGALLALLVLAALLGACAGEPEGPGDVVFPLPQRYTGSYTNDWGEPRPQGSHEGTDVFAPEGTPVYAITGGTVVAEGWNTLGGYTITIAAAYDTGPLREGDRLYYAHLRTSSPLEIGEEVRAGQKIGEVGRTAGEEVGSVADFPPHLHLGWYEGFRLFGESRAQAESGAMNPYPLLRRSAG